jgi:hypothetical protein
MSREKFATQADSGILSAARVKALLEVRAVTDPSWSAAGNHRNWAIVTADLPERKIAPGDLRTQAHSCL